MKRLTIFVRKWVVPVTFTLLIYSCKSGKIVSDAAINDNLTARTIIKKHYSNQLNFNTLRGRLKIDYSDGASVQSVGVSLRMERDKAIWLSAPLGVVKAYITPERVSFYNKLQNEYFDGDFTYLSTLLGTELNFEKVQNLLLGQTLFNLRNQKYFTSTVGNTYELKPINTTELFKMMFQIEPGNFKLAAQQIAQPAEKKLLDIKYVNYQEKERRILPHKMEIMAIDADNSIQIAIEYRNIEFNKPLNFPYRIPQGYEEIVLNK